MWYIFKENQCVATCDFEVCPEDLKSRDEIGIEDINVYNIAEITLVNNKIVKKEPYVPTSEEIIKHKLSQLDAEYDQQLTKLSKALGMATLADNLDLIASIKKDYAELIVEYNAKRGEIDGI